jgi:hypothetical protein
VDRPRGQAPLVLRELPETVGSKVWRGAWLLWKSLEVYGIWKNFSYTVYPPVIKDCNSKSIFALKHPFVRDFPFPRSITGGYPPFFFSAWQIEMGYFTRLTFDLFEVTKMGLVSTQSLIKSCIKLLARDLLKLPSDQSMIVNKLKLTHDRKLIIGPHSQQSNKADHLTPRTHIDHSTSLTYTLSIKHH